MPTHRIAYYADIHYKSDGAVDYWRPPANLDVEAILLAGDIHYAPRHLDTMLRRIRDTQRSETLLIVVPGNGDYIEQELASTRRGYAEVVAGIPNAVFLDDAAVDLPSGLRVIGSTLWSFVDGEEAARVTAALAEPGHEGVHMIRIGERLMTWNDATHLHLRARSYIEGQLYPRCANTHPRISSSAIRVSSRIRAPVKRSTASIRTSSRRRFWSSPSSE